MKLSLKNGIPFTVVTVAYKGNSAKIENVLVDTGSATTIFATDYLEQIGIVPQPDDILHTIRGVGGTEVVFARYIDYIQVGKCRLQDIEIEVGGMDYGFGINGVLGMDFLIPTGCIINLQKMELKFSI